MGNSVVSLRIKLARVLVGQAGSDADRRDPLSHANGAGKKDAFYGK